MTRFFATSLVALAAVMVMLSPAAAQPQRAVAGERCGPAYARDYDFRWTAADRLVATNGMASAEAVDGCATSDRREHAHVMAVLPFGTHIVTGVAFRASGPANRNLTVWASDTNVTAHIKVLRGSGDGPRRLLQHADRCHSRRGFNPEDRVYTLNCNPEVEVQGQFILFMAEALTVCDVLVCASQEEFTSHGVPLTREAALKDFQDNNSTITIGNIGKYAIEECDGYTDNRFWGWCPTGKKCVSTYKPGGSVCDCWDCTAFSDRRYCQIGDIEIGMQDCCFTCPDQPVCAVCETPCTLVFDRIEVIPGPLPRKPESISDLSFAYSSKSQAVNRGMNPQMVTVSFAMQQQLTATMTYAEAFAFSEKASFKVGIPFIGGTNLEFGATQTFTTTTTKTDQRTTTYTTALQQQIPPLTMQDVTATAQASMITTVIPVTINTYYTCGVTNSTNNTVTIQTSGVLAATAAQLTVEYGAQYPLEPPFVYPQANATCSSNPICSDLGLRVGNCCPNSDGIFLPCCSFCAAKPACKDYAIDNTTMCCPARTNRWNPCCGTRPTSPAPSVQLAP